MDDPRILGTMSLIETQLAKQTKAQEKCNVVLVRIAEALERLTELAEEQHREWND